MISILINYIFNISKFDIINNRIKFQTLLYSIYFIEIHHSLFYEQCIIKFVVNMILLVQCILNNILYSLDIILILSNSLSCGYKICYIIFEALKPFKNKRIFENIGQVIYSFYSNTYKYIYVQIYDEIYIFKIYKFFFVFE